MIYIVVGQSGAGKTTFCKNNIIKPPYENKRDIVKITIGGNGVVGIGDYGIGRRCEGTDTIPYNFQNKIIEQIKKLADENKDVLIEGDRITNKVVMESLKGLNTEKKLYLVTCKLETSLKRLRKAESHITIPFVKTTKTKAKRLYMNYSRDFNGEIINTEDNE